MVSQLLQTLFAKNSPVASGNQGNSGKADWDAYDAYVPPQSNSRSERGPLPGAGPEARRLLVQMWLETLPWAVRPIRLVQTHEQIAYTIALHWNEQRDLKRYMGQLIFSSENAKWCFTPEVFQELLRLDHYIDELRAIGQTVTPLLAEPRRSVPLAVQGKSS
ncbi:MAG: hypothetical protein ABSF50_06315 [Burkholderiaceae bacterium]|jgi:hypothetical protein